MGQRISIRLALLLAIGLAWAQPSHAMMPLAVVGGAGTINGILCDFTATEDPVSCGGNLDTPTDSDAAQYQISASGLARPNLACTGNCGAWWTTTFAATQEAFLTFPDAEGSDGNSVSVSVRVQQPGTSGPDGYRASLTIRVATDDIVIERMDNGAFTPLASGTQELSNDDKLCLRASGTSLTLYHYDGATWSSVLSTTDSTYQSSGHIAYTVKSNNLKGDDFGGGDGATACQ